MIRLGRGAREALLFHVELGQLEVEAQQGATLATGNGPARLAPGTRLRIRIDGARTRYEVQLGAATFESTAGPVRLQPGDGLALALGSAEVERYRAEFGAPEIEVVPLPAADRAAGGPRPGRGTGVSGRRTRRRPGGETAGRNRRPRIRHPRERGRLIVPLGESAAIHSLKTPVLVRLELDAVSRAGGGGEPAPPSRRLRPSPGAEEVVLSLAPGAHRYRSRCAGKAGREPAR